MFWKKETREQKSERLKQTLAKYKELEERNQQRQAEKVRVKKLEAEIRARKYAPVRKFFKGAGKVAGYGAQAVRGGAKVAYGGIRRFDKAYRPKKKRTKPRRYYYMPQRYKQARGLRQKRRVKRTSGRDYNAWDFTSGFRDMGF